MAGAWQTFFTSKETAEKEVHVLFALNGVIESGVLSDPDKFAKVAFACASTFFVVGERGVLACAKREEHLGRIEQQ